MRQRTEVKTVLVSVPIGHIESAQIAEQSRDSHHLNSYSTPCLICRVGIASEQMNRLSKRVHNKYESIRELTCLLSVRRQCSYSWGSSHTHTHTRSQGCEGRNAFPNMLTPRYTLHHEGQNETEWTSEMWCTSTYPRRVTAVDRREIETSQRPGCAIK